MDGGVSSDREKPREEAMKMNAGPMVGHRRSRRAVAAVLLAAAIAVSTPFSGVSAGALTGVFGGVTGFSFSGDEPEKAGYGSRYRATFGAVFEFDVHSGVRLSLQPAFTGKGTGIAYEIRGIKDPVDSVDVYLDYLSLPLTVKVFTRSGRWFVSGGLEMDWLLNAEYVTSTSKIDIAESMNPVDFVVRFGVGWVKPLGGNELFIEAVYSQSIVNVISADEPDEKFYDLRLKSSGMVICAGFLFQL